MLFRSGMTRANEGCSPPLGFFSRQRGGDTRASERRWLAVGSERRRGRAVNKRSFCLVMIRHGRGGGGGGFAAPRWPADGSGVVS